MNVEKNKVNNRNIYLLVLGLLLLLIITIIPYRFIFKGDFSNLNADWGDFGSYFGGILSPILTFITILILIITNQRQVFLLKEQLNEQKKQVDESVLNRKNSEIEKSILNTLKFIQDFLNSKVSKSMMLQYYKILDPDYVFEYDKILDTLIGIKEGIPGRIYIQESNLLKLINSAKYDMGIDKVKKELIEDDKLLIKHDLMSLKSQCDYLLGLVIKLNNTDYDKSSLKYYLSIIYTPYMILGEIGLVPKENIMNMALFQNISTRWEKLTIKRADLKTISKQAQLVQISDNNKIIDDYELKLEFENEKFILKNGKWVKIET